VRRVSDRPDAGYAINDTLEMRGQQRTELTLNSAGTGTNNDERRDEAGAGAATRGSGGWARRHGRCGAVSDGGTNERREKTGRGR
jgi:hypothetical protein